MMEQIATTGRLARSEVAQSKQAFALRDLDVAEDLVRQDARINRLNRSGARWRSAPTPIGASGR